MTIGLKRTSPRPKSSGQSSSVCARQRTPRAQPQQRNASFHESTADRTASTNTAGTLRSMWNVTQPPRRTRFHRWIACSAPSARSGPPRATPVVKYPTRRSARRAAIGTAGSRARHSE